MKTTPFTLSGLAHTSNPSMWEAEAVTVICPGTELVWWEAKLPNIHLDAEGLFYDR